EEKPESRANRADDFPTQRTNTHAEVGVGGRKFVREMRRDGVEFGLGCFRSDPGVSTSDDMDEPCFAALGAGVGVLVKGREDVGVASESERCGEYSNVRVGLTFEG